MTLIIQIAQANTKMLKWKKIWSNPACWLLPANKILAGFRQSLAGFLESNLSLEAHRHLHRLKPEKTDLNPSPFDQKSRPLNQIIGLAVPQGDVK